MKAVRFSGIFMFALSLCILASFVGCGKIEAPAPAAPARETAAPAAPAKAAPAPAAQPDTKPEPEAAANAVEAPETPAPAVTASENEAPQTVKTALASLPADFPKDVPIFENSTIEAAMSIGGEQHQIVGNAHAGLDEVVSFYKKECAARGWKETMTMAQGGEEAASFSTYEKDGRAMTVTVAQDEEGVHFSLSVASSEAE